MNAPTPYLPLIPQPKITSSVYRTLIKCVTLIFIVTWGEPSLLSALITLMSRVC